MDAKISEKHFNEWIELKETLDKVGRLTGISEGQILGRFVGGSIIYIILNLKKMSKKFPPTGRLWWVD